MSWESERDLDPGNPLRSNSPLILIGFVLGLLVMSPFPMLYYWLFAPAIPLMVGGLLVLPAAKWNRLFSVADGCFAAALFGLVFVVIGVLALGNIMPQ